VTQASALSTGLTIPRLLSIDVFRGITIALMIIVNSPGTQSPYAWLEHSVWDGCTLADLVFPFFIVIVGISSVLALVNLRAKGLPMSALLAKIIRRSMYIFLMGLALNAFPHHFDVSSIRILGVLQRIAICYFFSAILFLTTSVRTQAIIMLVFLSVYWWLMVAFAPLTYDLNLAGYLDRLVFAPGHLYTPTFDPEGLLSTIPAIASALLGNLIGVLLISTYTKQQKLTQMVVAGLLLAVLGSLLSYALPLNKALWSSSYVLMTGGLALLVFALVYALIEIQQWQRFAKPFALFGRHAMLAYMLHVLFLKLQALIHLHNAAGTIVGLRLYITEVLFGHLTPEFASLCYSVSYMLLWLFILHIVFWNERNVTGNTNSLGTVK